MKTQLLLDDLKFCTEKLLELAIESKWDLFELEWQKYNLKFISMPRIDWTELNEQERANFESVLLSIQETHLLLVSTTAAWHAELQSILQNSINSRKILDTYR